MSSIRSFRSSRFSRGKARLSLESPIRAENFQPADLSHASKAGVEISQISVQHASESRGRDRHESSQRQDKDCDRSESRSPSEPRNFSQKPWFTIRRKRTISTSPSRSEDPLAAPFQPDEAHTGTDENLAFSSHFQPDTTNQLSDNSDSQKAGLKMSPTKSFSVGHGSRVNSETSSYETDATSLPALQVKGVAEDDMLAPLTEEDFPEGSFDLVAPANSELQQYSLEARSEQLFSSEHLRIIFSDPTLLLRFTAFLSHSYSSAIPILIYYLDAIKALKALSYSNAIAEGLDPIPGLDFTTDPANVSVNPQLEAKANKAFNVLVRDSLPAYITHIYVQTVSSSITRRIAGTLPIHLRETSEGLAEVFCLTDPSRPDNPIVFASEEFHRTTQYGMDYVIGRNCRFLQGPKTNPFSVRRFHEKIKSGQEHCEVFLNYRRDGSPFMNLLMVAPLCDSRGKIRYHIGAQVDVSGLVKECVDLESLKRVVIAADHPAESKKGDADCASSESSRDEFQELSEMLNMQELDTVRRWGGRMHREQQEEILQQNGNSSNWNKPRILIHGAQSPDESSYHGRLGRPGGKLSGVYENYLLVRPYPSLRVLFASPSLRTPGILQSLFLDKIGGSNRVREELTQALADSRGVTAKVRWVTKADPDGRGRWIHCTPLLGSNGAVGVWMVVVVDDERDGPAKPYKRAPPIDPKFGRNVQSSSQETESLRDFAIMHGGRDRPPHLDSKRSESSLSRGRPGSLNSVTI